MNYEDQTRPIAILSQRQRQITDLRAEAPPSIVRVYDLNMNFLRIEPATFWDGNILGGGRKRKNNGKGHRDE